MAAVASIDGVIAPLAEARVPVTDRGLLFGDHVFEIARAIDARVIDGDAHLARLAASARAIGVAPPPIDPLAAWIAAAIAAAGEADAAIRVIWSRGDGTALRPSPTAAPRAIILVEPCHPGPATIRLASIAVDRSGRTGALVPATAKTGSYLASILALARAAELGADDALLIDPDGRALETATASLFAVVADRVIAADGAALPGVTAARVVALLAARGVDVVAGAVTAAALTAADELFVTSSRRGITPVVAVDGRALAVGPTTRAAIDAYQRWLRGS